MQQNQSAKSVAGSELFKRALDDEMESYGVSLSVEVRENLAKYFELLSRWNERLHLVAPCSPEEFATRHVLESLTLLHHLSGDAVVVDVGSGGGLPLIPCLIAKPGIRGTMIEASKKKSVFLNEALRRLDLSQRARVVTQRFENVGEIAADFVTCRALEQLVKLAPELIEWAPPGSKLLLFGGESLGEVLQNTGRQVERILLPRSERRFLFSL